MKFANIVSNIARINDLRRIAKAHLFDVSRLDEDELKSAVIGKAKQYSDGDILADRLQQVIFHREADVRIIGPILLGEILIQRHGYNLTQKEAEDAVLDWEQDVIDESNEQTEKGKRQIYNFEFFTFVLEAAWDNDNEISLDEKKLIEKIRCRLNISMREYRLAEAGLGKFPKDKNALHIREEVNRVRTTLQELGLLLTYRDSQAIDHDVIPEEMAIGLRKFFGVEIKRFGFTKLIAYKSVRNKSYLENCLSKSNITLAGPLTVPQLQELCVAHLKPSVILGGTTPRDGLEKEQIEKWCRDLQLPVSGTKSELIERIIVHYDELIETTSSDSDEREKWFEYFEEFAARNYGFLRSQELIEKDQDVDKRFEYATDFLFEVYLNHKPLSLAGSEQPDGALSLGDKVLLWDNKSKEKQCDLKIHLAQFQRYFTKAEKRVAALMVVAPSFTPESEQQAKLHQIETGNQISLITAAELKNVATLWKSSKKSDDPFPLGYLTTTGRFDPALVSTLVQ